VPLTRILPLGDPRLRCVSPPILNPVAPDTLKNAALLSRTFASFRSRYGFGHGIAAPQIGILQRMIALRPGLGPEVLLNPLITWQSEETTVLWDSCMCFPFLLVRVRRPASITLTYTDLSGREHSWEGLDPWLSALLAHEVDHLDGILAVDHAIDRESLVSREAYEADPVFYQQLADPVTEPRQYKSPP
jgi:peptide deformylase